MSLGQRELPFQTRWRLHTGTKRWNDLTPYEQGLVFLAPYSEVRVSDAAIQVDLIKAHGDGLWYLMCIADAHLEARGLIDRRRWDDNRRHQFSRLLRGTEIGDRFIAVNTRSWEKTVLKPIDEGTLEHWTESKFVEHSNFTAENADVYLTTFHMLLCTEASGGQQPSSGIDELVYRPEPKLSQKVLALTDRQKIEVEIGLHRRTHSSLEQERAITLAYLKRDSREVREVLAKSDSPRRAAITLMRFAVQEELRKPDYYFVPHYPKPEAFPLLDTCLACLNTMEKLKILDARQHLFLVKRLMHDFCGHPAPR